MEAVAQANPIDYAWRSDAINIYIVNSIAGAGGACSFPTAHEIIGISNQGLLNGQIGWLHEIGHYLSLTHTFSIVTTSCPFSNVCDPTVGATHSFGTIVACPDICPDTTNVMSYNCLVQSTASLTDCQLEEIDYELFDPSGSRAHVVKDCAQVISSFDCTLQCTTDSVLIQWSTAPGSGGHELRRNGHLISSSIASSFLDSPGIGAHTYQLVVDGCERECSVIVPENITSFDHVIWPLGGGPPNNSAAMLESALIANAGTVTTVSHPDELLCLERTQRLWVVCGTSLNAHELSLEEGAQLRAALEQGVHTYIEGADLWSGFAQTEFHQCDGIAAGADDGDDSFLSMTGHDFADANLSDMNADYTQAVGAGNDSTDQLTTAVECAGYGAGVLWRNNDPTDNYVTGIFYRTPPEYGNLICQSWNSAGTWAILPNLPHVISQL